MSVPQSSFPDKAPRPSNREQLERVAQVLERTAQVLQRSAADIRKIIAPPRSSRSSAPAPAPRSTYDRSTRQPRPPASPRRPSRRPRSWQRTQSFRVPREGELHGVGCRCGMCPASTGGVE